MASVRDGNDTPTAALIGFESGLGARDARCAAGPAALRAAGLTELLAAAGVAAGWRESVSALPGGPISDVVAALCGRVAETVVETMRDDTRFAVIGGDHSCAAGTWAGAANVLRPHGQLGLIWIDAHMDSHTPETTPSGTYHGMPLAALMGHGDPALAGIAGPAPALSPAHVALVGVRSFEWQEDELLRALGVRVFPMAEIDRRGLAAVMEEAAAIVLDGTAGAGISIDLDVLDPVSAPGVGSPVPGGLDPGALVAAVARLGRDARFTGCEIVEYNPALDVDGRTAAIAAALSVAFFGGGQA
jgi:arginase